MGVSFARTVFPLLAASFVVTLMGCEEEQVQFLEVRRVDEPVSDSDIEMLERVASKMESGRLPAMSPHFLPPPNWEENRPATVSTLAREELERLRESTQLDAIMGQTGRKARLRIAVKKEKLTLEQYTAIVLAVGLAYQRSKVDPARDLDNYVSVGRGVLRDLAKRDESFATLTRDQQIRATDDATWITRVDRAERMLKIPDSNAALAEKFSDRLAKILPERFLFDPLATVSDPLRDFGIPFRERADSGFDSELTWSRTDEQAVVGGQSTAKKDQDRF